eukprot:256538_1
MFEGHPHLLLGVCVMETALSQRTTASNTEQTESDETEIIVIVIVTGVIVLLASVVGCIMFNKKRRESSKKDISNLDIEEMVEVADSETTKDSNKQMQTSKHKQINGKQSKAKRKHSNDVLDIEEDDHNTKHKIIVTSSDGITITNDTKTKTIPTDSDDDDLSYIDGHNMNQKQSMNADAQTVDPEIDLDDASD